MILTDDECRNIYNAAMELPDRTAVNVTRYIEAAILAKLREQEPIAYFYHDASSAEKANPLFHSTLLLMASERRPNCRNETPLYAHPPSQTRIENTQNLHTSEQRVQKTAESIHVTEEEEEAFRAITNRLSPT